MTETRRNQVGTAASGALLVSVWTQSGPTDLSGEDDDDSSKEDEEEDELDKKMGDLGDGQTDTLDERLWGDEEDEEDEEASEKEEESGQGMDQVELDLQDLQCRTHGELLMFSSNL